MEMARPHKSKSESDATSAGELHTGRDRLDILLGFDVMSSGCSGAQAPDAFGVGVSHCCGPSTASRLS